MSLGFELLHEQEERTLGMTERLVPRLIYHI